VRGSGHLLFFGYLIDFFIFNKLYYYFFYLLLRGIFAVVCAVLALRFCLLLRSRVGSLFAFYFFFLIFWLWFFALRLRRGFGVFLFRHFFLAFCVLRALVLFAGCRLARSAAVLRACGWRVYVRWLFLRLAICALLI
jgi:hypothetical protein